MDVKSKFLDHPNELGVVGVCFSGGQGKQGVESGPQALADAGLFTQLEELGYKLHGTAKPRSLPTQTSASGADIKDVISGESEAPSHIHDYKEIIPEPSADTPHRGMKNPRTVSVVTRALSEQVYSHARQGRMVLTVGGDHSIAMGTISGVARGVRERAGRPDADLAVIWVDAHADLNRPEDSPSGNVHGMPLAFLTGLAEEKDSGDKDNSKLPLPFTWFQDPSFRIKPRDLVYIALRDVDAGEKKLLREHNIKAFSMHEVDRYGIGRVVEMALEYIGRDKPIHLSFDVDALDPMWASSTGTPVRGGLTLREGDFICEAVHQTGQLVAFDLVEVNPSLAPDEKGAHDTVGAGCSLIRCAMGESLL